MQTDAKTELARAIRDTRMCREATYIKGTCRYAKTIAEAAEQVIDDPDVRVLVTAMLQSGFSDFPEWADNILRPKAA